MSRDDPSVPASRTAQLPSSREAIDSFLTEARRAADVTARGRLVFALDATMSRQPTWDMACRLQAEMFGAAAQGGSLAVQLVYFRGLGECRASSWIEQASRLSGLMTRIDCRGGHTQIGRVLAHVRQEAARTPLRALVYVGDAMEEDADALCVAAGELGLRGIPAFMFLEGADPVAEATFREIARLSGGVFRRFDPGSAAALGELLKAAAVYAAGGRMALETYARGQGQGHAQLAGMLKELR